MRSRTEKTMKLTASFITLPVNIKTDLLLPITAISQNNHQEHTILVEINTQQREKERERERERERGGGSQGKCEGTHIRLLDSQCK